MMMTAKIHLFSSMLFLCYKYFSNVQVTYRNMKSMNIGICFNKTELIQVVLFCTSVLLVFVSK